MNIAFGVNIGNLGLPGKHRHPMDAWIADGNRKLAGTPTRVLDSFGHTGNFVVQSEHEHLEVARELSAVFDAAFSVLTVEELAGHVHVIEEIAQPDPRPGVRWTPGLVFAVQDTPVANPVLIETSHARFNPVAMNVVGAWKRDQLTDSSTLDRDRRGGGWGAVSNDVSRQLGGKWTARSLRTVKGVLDLARQHASPATQLTRLQFDTKS